MKRDIPSLDGLRAIAVALVVASHLHALPSTMGLLGVRVFFVISGYLITRLLTKELDRSGTISLSRFYFRRTLRIFPAYYAMLAVAYVLGAHGFLETQGAHWGWLVSYTSNLGPTQPNDVGHAWSLGVEEQFYLVWPAVLLVAGKRRGLTIALGAIITMIAVRLAWFALFHDGRPVFATPDDFLAAGCALSLIRARNCRWRLAPWLVPAIVAYALAFSMSTRWRFAFDMTLGQPLTAIAIAVVVAWCITTAPRWLNGRVVRAIGVGSYSLYLYQELWLHVAWPLALLGMAVSAAASYYLIERPGLRLRERLEAWRVAVLYHA